MEPLIVLLQQYFRRCVESVKDKAVRPLLKLNTSKLIINFSLYIVLYLTKKAKSIWHYIMLHSFIIICDKK